MGISFAYVPTLLAIGGQFDLPTILGAEIVGGCVAILFGIFVKQIRKLLDRKSTRLNSSHIH